VANNPFNLHEDQNGLVCNTLPVSCDDFATQAEAQNWWDQFGLPQDDLDPDDDTIVCENLP
jgi:homoserine acetyltransferase